MHLQKSVLNNLSLKISEYFLYTIIIATSAAIVNYAVPDMELSIAIFSPNLDRIYLHKQTLAAQPGNRFVPGSLKSAVIVGRAKPNLFTAAISEVVRAASHLHPIYF